MFRAKIQEKIETSNQSQLSICSALDITPQNFNGFLKGQRPLPYDTLVKVMNYLHLSVGLSNIGYAKLSADNLPEIFKRRIVACNLKVTDLSKHTGVSGASISSFINGKRSLPARNMEKIMKVLRLDVLPLKSKTQLTQ